MTRAPGNRPECHAGFTLIEVVGALVLFTLALLMVIRLSGGMGEELERAAVSSEIALLARQKMDSLETLHFDSLEVGTEQQTVTVRGAVYRRTVTVSLYGPLLKEVSVTFTPTTSGPEHEATSYVSGSW